MKRDDPFGFFGEATSTPKPKKTKQKQLTDKEKLSQIRDLVEPLLINLRDSADKPTIVWPNRAPEIQRILDEIDKLTKE